MKKRTNTPSKGTHKTEGVRKVVPWARAAHSLGDLWNLLNEAGMAFGDEDEDINRLRGILKVNDQRLAFCRLALKAGAMKSVTELPTLPGLPALTNR